MDIICLRNVQYKESSKSRSYCDGAALPGVDTIHIQTLYDNHMFLLSWFTQYISVHKLRRVSLVFMFLF